MGPGCGLLDYDGDGLLDILLIDGGPRPAADTGVVTSRRTPKCRSGIDAGCSLEWRPVPCEPSEGDITAGNRRRSRYS